MSWLGEKKKVDEKPFRQRSFTELFTAAPIVLIGVVATFGGLGYGLYGMMFGTMEQQSRGMAMRVGFQFATIAALMTTIGYQQHIRDQETIKHQNELWEARVEARRKAKEAKKALDAKN